VIFLFDGSDHLMDSISESVRGVRHDFTGYIRRLLYRLR